MSPMGAVLRGLLAGAVGTVAMDAVWYSRYRRGGGRSGPLEWEFASEVDTWDKAPTPAQVGRRLAEGFTQKTLAPGWAAPMTNLMHWGYGSAWGVLYGILAGSSRKRRLAAGLPFGGFVWSSSYAILPLAGLYKPIWEYDAKTLGKDLSAHLAYGLGTAAAFNLMSRL